MKFFFLFEHEWTNEWSVWHLLQNQLTNFACSEECFEAVKNPWFENEVFISNNQLVQPAK